MDSLPPVLRVRWLDCLNQSGEIVPSWALARVAGVNSAGQLLIDKPREDGVGDDEYVVNGPHSIPIGEGGSCTADWPAEVAYNTAGGTPANGEEWGPANGSWELTKNNLPGFWVAGVGVGASTAVVLASAESIPDVSNTVKGKVNLTQQVLGAGNKAIDGNLFFDADFDNAWITAKDVADDSVENHEVWVQADYVSGTQYAEIRASAFNLEHALDSDATGSLFLGAEDVRLQCDRSFTDSVTTLTVHEAGVKLATTVSEITAATAYEIVDSVGTTHTGAWGTTAGGDTVSGGLITVLGTTAGSITVGTTTITSGTAGGMLYNNAGSLGNAANVGISSSGYLNTSQTSAPAAGSMANSSIHGPYLRST